MDATQDESPDTETYRMYWQVQHQRIAQHENGRFQVSAYVVASSLVAVGVVAQGDPGPSVRWVTTLGVALINVLAVIFIVGERRWLKVHQARAKVALQALAPELVELQSGMNKERGIGVDGSARNAPFRSSNVLASMHVVLATATLLVALSASL